MPALHPHTSTFHFVSVLAKASCPARKKVGAAHGGAEGGGGGGGGGLGGAGGGGGGGVVGCSSSASAQRPLDIPRSPGKPGWLASLGSAIPRFLTARHSGNVVEP